MSDLLIVGTGALACLFAARLAAVGVSVTMLGTWREGLAALRMYGVTLVQPDGRQTSYPVQVVDQTGLCSGSKYALVLVKSWQTERAAKQMAECLAPDGIALTLQNGLGNYETLAEVLGPERVALGTTTTGATLLSSGRVRPGGEGVISVGGYPQLAPLLEMLRQAGFALQQLDDVQALIWGKLVVNAAINPLTAILKMSNGGIISRPSARQLAADLAREVIAVAEGQGIALPFADPVQIAEDVARKTADNYSSMVQDIQRGAPTEIDAICGAVVQKGQAVGVPTPINYSMWKLIHALVEEHTEN
ncbi:2-dehydropantoate 2-reductase [bacterium]|nr:2-dehydropantoate 2-reductase [bacterium]MCB2179212.1 2-dehydropantoate 2-reductase [bacterium]